MKYQISSVNLFVVFLLSAFTANSQAYQVIGEESEMTVDGTSTLHDWHSEFLNLKGNAIIRKEDNKITDITEMVLKIVVESFESGKGGMEKNAREALKEEEYPVIQYTLTRLEGLDDDDNEILGLGLLTIAGITREINMNVNYSISDHGIITFEGSLDLAMTEFQIDPPTALLGTIKTGDAISVNYKVLFKQQ